MGNNETVKSEMGMRAGALLCHRLVFKAKRLLVHTDLTSAQVAEMLGFKDPSYFGSFFKRKTGQTPRDSPDEFYP
jgi:AraC-like DNA-binding protein